MRTERAKKPLTKPAPVPVKKPEDITRWENEGGAVKPTGGLATTLTRAAEGESPRPSQTEVETDKNS